MSSNYGGVCFFKFDEEKVLNGPKNQPPEQLFQAKKKKMNMTQTTSRLVYSFFGTVWSKWCRFGQNALLYLNKMVSFWLLGF